ncbi:MAG: Hsp20/alpha crystallin family protein [Nitrospiria bacterium]
MYVRELTPWVWGSRNKQRNRSTVAPVFSFGNSRVEALLDELAEDFDRSPFGFGGRKNAAFHPQLNLLENDTAYEVSVELPGLDTKDIDLTVENDVLSIRGEKKNESNGKEGNVYRMERTYGTFQRAILFPSPIDEEKVEAKFEKGILNIKLPKTQEAQKKIRRIDVKAA